MNDEKLDFEIIDWDTFQSLVKKVAKMIKESGYKPDIIIGLARGGWAISRLLSDYIDVKDFASLNVKLFRAITGSHEQTNLCNFNIDLSQKRVIIVDDINRDIDMKIAFEFSELLKPSEIRTLSLIYISGSRFKPNYFAKKMYHRKIIFPWNFMENMRNMT